MLRTIGKQNCRFLRQISKLREDYIGVFSLNDNLCHQSKLSYSTEYYDPNASGAASGHHKTTKNLLDESASFTADKEVEGGDDWHSRTYGREKKALDKLRQRDHVEVPGIDPNQTSIFLFPGQGTQYVGMSKDLIQYPGVREMYEAASEILGYNLLQVSIEGPLSELSRTEVQQPAIFVASLAAVEKLREENPAHLERCVACAGFSVGEITALTFAGSLTFDDAIRLLQVRGEAMQIASDMAPSGMMTVFHGPGSRLKFGCTVAIEYCKKNGIEDPDCKIANFLYPHCSVVAGNEEALDFLVRNKDDFRLKKLKRINVSGAFHSNLMKPAAEAFKQALQDVQIERPQIFVYSNYDAKCYQGVLDILKKLPKQIARPVLWEQTMHALYERKAGLNFPYTFECGPGKSLVTILKKHNAKAFNSANSICA